MNILKSRTVWTLAFIFVFNGFAAISDELPAQAVLIINGVFGLLAAYFKIKPSQNYGG